MADPELVPEAIHEQDGLKVSKSPWGPDDEIGRLNWITPETNAAILGHLDGRHVSTSSTSSGCRRGSLRATPGTASG
jgi:hypothetical protein